MIVSRNFDEDSTHDINESRLIHVVTMKSRSGNLESKLSDYDRSIDQMKEVESLV